MARSSYLSSRGSSTTTDAFTPGSLTSKGFEDPESTSALVQANERATELRAIAHDMNEQWESQHEARLLERQAEYDEADSRQRAADELERSSTARATTESSSHFGRPAMKPLAPPCGSHDPQSPHKVADAPCGAGSFAVSSPWLHVDTRGREVQFDSIQLQARLTMTPSSGLRPAQFSWTELAAELTCAGATARKRSTSDVRWLDERAVGTSTEPTRPGIRVS
jgi:hypothetical protein